MSAPRALAPQRRAARAAPRALLRAGIAAMSAADPPIPDAATRKAQLLAAQAAAPAPAPAAADYAAERTHFRRAVHAWACATASSEGPGAAAAPNVTVRVDPFFTAAELAAWVAELQGKGYVATQQGPLLTVGLP